MISAIPNLVPGMSIYDATAAGAILSGGFVACSGGQYVHLGQSVDLTQFHVLFVMRPDFATSTHEAFGGFGSLRQWHGLFDDRGAGQWRFRMQSRPLAAIAGMSSSRHSAGWTMDFEQLQ